MMKVSQNAIAVSIAGAIPISLYWLGGGSFDREPMLAVTAGFSLGLAACASGLWGSKS